MKIETRIANMLFQCLNLMTSKGLLVDEDVEDFMFDTFELTRGVETRYEYSELQDILVTTLKAYDANKEYQDPRFESDFKKLRKLEGVDISKAESVLVDDIQLDNDFDNFLTDPTAAARILSSDAFKEADALIMSLMGGF